MATVAIIGCGRMGERHIEAVLGLNMAIIGLMDHIPETATSVAEKHGIDKRFVFANFDDLVSAEKPDLLIIATTANAHHEYTLKAAQAGISHVLCEKPMAVSIQQCDEMIKACEEANTQLAINHPVRFTEADIAIKELLTSDKMGGLNSIQISAGNFGLAMNASHNLEMFRYLTDETPVSVQAWLDDEVVPNPRGEQFEDRSGSLRIKTPGGKTMTINASADNGHGIMIVYTARLGQIALNVLTGQALVTYRQEEFRDRATTFYAAPAENSVEEFKSSDLVVRSQKVITALINNNNYPSGSCIKPTIEILAAAYLSQEQGHKEINIATDELEKNLEFLWA